MEGIVIYFSIFENNKNIAERLAENKNFELYEFSPGSIMRVFQFFFGKKKLKKRAQELNSIISKYNTIIICGPIWAAKPAPAIDALTEELNLENKNIEFHFTYTQDYGNTKENIEELIEKKLATLEDIIFTNISKKK